MTLPTAGALSFLDIQGEFGGAAPISLNEYYRGGVTGYVPIGAAAGTGSFQTAPLSVASPAQISTSGGIQISQFYGTRRVFIFTETVSSNILTGYNLAVRAATPSIGSNTATVFWDGVAPLIATVTVNAGVTITNTQGNIAFTSFRAGGYPAGSTFGLSNNGNIIGGGGSGGPGGNVSGAAFSNGQPGSVGGTGIVFEPSFTLTTTVFNGGTIAGGGGGGGGGNATRNDPSGKLIDFYGAAGGGGGGATGASAANGGAAGTASGNTSGNVAASPGASAGNASNPKVSPSIYTYGAGGGGGLIGSVIRGGTGGDSGEAGIKGFPGNLGDQGYVNGGQGGVGNGGNAGAAIFNGSVPSWNNYGAIRGTFDNFGAYTGGGSDFSALLGAHRSNQVFSGHLNGAWTSALGPFWYWSSQGSGSINQPAGNTTFYMMYNNTGASFSARLYGAADNSLASMTVNGVAFTPGTSMVYTTTSQTNAFTIVQGINVITITINNSAVSAAGFNIRMRDLSNVDLTHPSQWYY